MTLPELHSKDRRRVKCVESECGYEGTIAEVELHDCEIQRQGGRCEDYPCCGHIDGDGCQPLPSHTSDFYYRNPHLLHEPGSPEWFDAMDEYADEPEDLDPMTCPHDDYIEWNRDGAGVTCRGCWATLEGPLLEDGTWWAP